MSNLFNSTDLSGTDAIFPTQGNLAPSSYPDITDVFKSAAYQMMDALANARYTGGDQAAKDLISTNFKSGGIWDLNTHPNFPSVTSDGKQQLAKFGEGIATGGFLTHHLYGKALSSIGYHPDFSGGVISEMPSDLPGKPFPIKEFPETISNPDMVMSGFHDSLGDNRWQSKSFSSDSNTLSLNSKTDNIGLSSSQEPELDTLPPEPTVTLPPLKLPSERTAGIVLKGHVEKSEEQSPSPTYPDSEPNTPDIPDEPTSKPEQKEPIDWRPLFLALSKLAQIQLAKRQRQSAQRSVSDGPIASVRDMPFTQYPQPKLQSVPMPESQTAPYSQSSSSAPVLLHAGIQTVQSQLPDLNFKPYKLPVIPSSTADKVHPVIDHFNQNVMQPALSTGKDLLSATMLASTGALKGATLGYADMTQDARDAGRIIGANPEVYNNPWLNHVGEGVGMLVPGSAIAKAVQPLKWGHYATAAAEATTLAGTYRRPGELTFENQLDVFGRMRDAAIAAGTSTALLKVIEVFPQLKAFFAQRLFAMLGIPAKMSAEELTQAFIQWARTDMKLTEHEIAYLLGKTDELPPVRQELRRLWTEGKPNNPLENARDHILNHAEEFNLPKDNPYYVKMAHDFVKNPPIGTEIKLIPGGYRLYYYEPENIYAVINQYDNPISLYKPTNGRNWFDAKEFIEKYIITK